MSSKSRLLLIVGLFLVQGCASTGMYSSRTGFALFSTQTEAGSLGQGSDGQKKGEACSSNVLGIVAFGDSSISEARKTSNIKEVQFVDFSYTNILGLYGKVCTVIYGK